MLNKGWRAQSPKKSDRHTNQRRAIENRTDSAHYGLRNRPRSHATGLTVGKQKLQVGSFVFNLSSIL